MVKVCGMREAKNIAAVSYLRPDYMGFIFYKKSPRYVAPDELKKTLTSQNNNLESIRKVGVFVNSDFEEITKVADTLNLQVIQLHGQETPELVQKLKERNLKVWKVFSVETELPIEQMGKFDGLVNAFLFDTKTAGHGGSGQRFSWSALEEYPYSAPFILSGGIGPEHSEEINQLEHPKLWGVDVNSRFEIEPAIKDSAQLSQFIQDIKKENK